MSELVKIYLEIGILGIIAIIYLYDSRKTKKSTDKKFDSMFEMLLKTKTIHTEEEDKVYTEMEHKIDSVLEHLLVSTKADRAFLIRYHNGGKDLAGNSFLKMSMSNERVGIGIKAMQPEFKDQFRSAYSWFIGQLEENGTVNINDMEELQDLDTNMYQFFTGRKIDEFHGIVIHSEKGNIIGFIGIEFLNIREQKDINKINSCLRDKKLKIDTILSCMRCE